MQKEIELRLSPQDACDTTVVKEAAAAALGIAPARISHVRIAKRSVDARSRLVWIQLALEVFTDGQQPDSLYHPRTYPNVKNAPEVIVVGSGPAGMFAALKLIELGLRPIVLERGKNIHERARDIRALNREHLVNPDSNYCFGEGGAGTYSDGKLYTRSKKRGNVEGILSTLVEHGAVEDILRDAHPHIGTNKLPRVVENIRRTILESSGEYFFGERVESLIIENGVAKGVKTASGNIYRGEAVILATGHSARDIYRMLHAGGILLEQKTIAVGVRIEHPQELIDKMQYGPEGRGQYLPAASYKMVEQCSGRGVYSFCMCPGGFIVPSATGAEQVVVNGMSPSLRNNRFANSGLVVSIEPEDLKGYESHGVLATLTFQQEMEHRAWIAGGKTQTAPAQRMTDFCSGRLSDSLNPTSYLPGIAPAPLDEVLGKHIATRLKEGLNAFCKKKHIFMSREANLIGVETRTSSPVRIPRQKDTLSHPQVKGLFPAGEGAGFAGGIVSAAIDGENCALAVKFYIDC